MGESATRATAGTVGRLALLQILAIPPVSLRFAPSQPTHRTHCAARSTAGFKIIAFVQDPDGYKIELIEQH